MSLLKKSPDTSKSKANEKGKKNRPKEFFDALIYAAVVAFIIKIFLFEAYRIPTGSMENTLLVGDFLLVTKFTYGATTPRNVPFSDIRLPYWKLPGFKDPERGDIIVFDFPGDKDELESKEVVNYIKRCVGLAGDTIQVIDKKLYVNGAVFPDPPGVQYSRQKLEPNNVNFRIYPKGAPWNEDFYGPIRVPKKGDKIKIDEKNFDQWRMFALKEGHKIQLNPGGVITSDGAALTNNEYTVERNYLFMMGDNRNNSLDSRYWGFMPEQNIVGQAFMIYWSWDANIPFSRFFDLLGTIRWGRIGSLIK